jgi:hypothetical protein
MYIVLASESFTEPEFLLEPNLKFSFLSLFLATAKPMEV